MVRTVSNFIVEPTSTFEEIAVVSPIVAEYVKPLSVKSVGTFLTKAKSAISDSPIVIATMVAASLLFDCTKAKAAVALALIDSESAFNPSARNPSPNSTAAGLLQINRPTLTDLSHNINTLIAKVNNPIAKYYPDLAKLAPYSHIMEMAHPTKLDQVLPNAMQLRNVFRDIDKYWVYDKKWRPLQDTLISKEIFNVVFRVPGSESNYLHGLAGLASLRHVYGGGVFTQPVTHAHAGRVDTDIHKSTTIYAALDSVFSNFFNNLKFQ